MKIKIHFDINTQSRKKISSKTIKFIPEEAKVTWNDLEIHPIFENKDGLCDIVPEGQETFWSVYIHQVQGGIRCIADVPTKKDAIKLTELINILTATRIR